MRQIVLCARWSDTLAQMLCFGGIRAVRDIAGCIGAASLASAYHLTTFLNHDFEEQVHVRHVRRAASGGVHG